MNCNTKATLLNSSVRYLISFFIALTGTSAAFGQEKTPTDVPTQSVTSLDELTDKPIRWLLVICGMPGDEPHREQLTKAMRQIAIEGAEVFGIAAGQRIVLAGDAEMVASLEPQFLNCEVANAESIERAITSLARQLGPRDSCWVFVLGHANLYGKNSYLNIEGKDISQNDFAKAFAPLQLEASAHSDTEPSPERVVWICSPVSGQWLKPLAKTGCVLISATEAGAELTATEMAYALGDVLAGEAEHQELTDIDHDSKLTLLDLYLAVNIEITSRFVALEYIQTEHAQLDDDGDGRGRELQTEYLPTDPLAPPQRNYRKLVKESIRDGRVANQILIRQPKSTSRPDNPSN